MGPLLHDGRWVRHSFLVTKENLDKLHFQNRTFSSAQLKFTDTTPGGNFAINPPPQFTRTCDIKAEGLYAINQRGDGTRGMGRYYSEAIDDNSQVIYMRFGVPQFNSLTTFFTGFYDSAAGQLARTGRGNGVLHTVGMMVGFIASMVNAKIIMIHLAGLALRFAAGAPSSKFYYLKPTMPIYWNAVNTIVNQICINRGIVPRLFGPDKSAFERNYEFDDDAIKQLAELIPEIFNKGGGIDIYAMAGRAQRLATRRYKALEEKMSSDQNMSIEQAVVEVMSEQSAMDDSTKRDYSTYLADWFSKPAAKSKETDVGINSDSTLSSATNANNTTAPVKDSNTSTGEQLPATEEEHKGFLDFLMSELDDGSAFASFRVNSTGGVSESFSNNVGESELSSKINGMSSSSRSTNFSFAGGNLDSGVIGKTVGAVAGAVGDFIKGVGDGLGVSGLAALGGSAFVDIPKHWQSSTANLPRSSYTINLVSPYGNPISQLINLHIPLAMLLAAALPLATGKRSYTSPFLVELYDKGRCQTRLGMIDSLSITRGTGNLGFDREGNAMAIDVSFSIIDMSSIMTVPITQGFSMDALSTGLTLGSLGGVAAGAVVGSVGGVPGAIAGGVVGGLGGAAIGGAVGSGVDAVGNVLTTVNKLFDDDNAFSDYLACIAGMGLADQIYSSRKIKLNLTRAMQDWKTWYSPAHYASFAGDTAPARLASSIFRGVER